MCDEVVVLNVLIDDGSCKLCEYVIDLWIVLCNVGVMLVNGMWIVDIYLIGVMIW